MAYAGGAPMRDWFKGKLVIAIAIIAIVGVTILMLYFYLSFTTLLNGRGHSNVKLPAPRISASISSQDVLNHDGLKQLVPFVLLNYYSANVSNINANASLYKYPPPRRTFILNVSNECFNCGNTGQIGSDLAVDLQRYGLILGPGNLSTISPSNVRALPPNSILIILNGLLPASLLQTNGSKVSGLTYLLNEHTSIIYVGQDFSKMLLPDSIVTPTPAALRPGYLYTDNLRILPVHNSSFSFYFNSSTFIFANGSNYGTATYINAYNGSIFAFSNTPDSWPANQSAADIAKAVRDLFWLPRYAYGTATVKLPTTSNHSSELGVVLDSAQAQTNNAFVTAASQSGSLRIMVTANGSYSTGTSNSTYQYLFSRPLLNQNGTVSIQNYTITNQSIPINFTVYTMSSSSINLTSSVTVYTTNLSVVDTLPIPYIHDVSSNFTFLKSERLQLPPGEQYIIKLHNFSGAELGAALFNISPVSVMLIKQNLTNGSFTLSVTSQKLPLNNINYSISLDNNLYPANGTIKNGLIYYSLPKGTPEVHGTINFTLDVMGSKSQAIEYYYPTPFSINQQYIEIAIVAVIMLLMIVLVKAPNRDEFYIDVPNLPEAAKIPIKLKPQDVVGVFDRLNTQYHWKYMPLSKAEIKSAISTYIKVNNIPVSLTFNNIDRIVDILTANKYLITADELYAPSAWAEQSKHDVEYLAIFKKMRIYLVTHAYAFTDLDVSQSADIVATLRNEKKYLVIYSKSDRFQKVPIYTGSKTYLIFLNAYKLDEFKDMLYESSTMQAEELKMYIGAGYLRLVDADNPDQTLT